MRKLKLQMHISLDGFVATKSSEIIPSKWDNGVRLFSIDNFKNVDAILLGRKTAEILIPYWGGVAGNPKHSDYKLGKLITDIPKVVFSKKIKTSKWDNTTIAKGDIAKEIKKLKKKKGKDILIYGGYSFVSSLIQHKLIDEFYLLVNPTAVGNGQTIFSSLKDNLQLTLEKSKTFACGTVLLFYKPKK